MTDTPNPERERLRDEFAMAALTGMLSNSRGHGHPNQFAADAYMYADAMLKERDRHER